MRSRQWYWYFTLISVIQQHSELHGEWSADAEDDMIDRVKCVIQIKQCQHRYVFSIYSQDNYIFSIYSQDNYVSSIYIQDNYISSIYSQDNIR